jgi:predicted lipid-binding transport protein (Tim44 family)
MEVKPMIITRQKFRRQTLKERLRGGQSGFGGLGGALLAGLIAGAAISVVFAALDELFKMEGIADLLSIYFLIWF